MKTFYILNHKFLPTPYNHRFFVEKFARGFAYSGYDVKLISSVKDIGEPGFVMISNHYFFHGIGRNDLNSSRISNFIRKFFTFLALKDRTKIFIYFSNKLRFYVLSQLSKKIQNLDTVVIAWFWDDNENYFIKNKIKVIFTGEYPYKTPISIRHKKWHEFYISKKNALPIEFASDVDPKSLEFKWQDKVYSIGYVGNKNYKSDWYSYFSNRVNCKIIPTPPFILEEERVDIYKKSKIILGFHSEDNIKNGIVVERVFESLMMGSLCITDHPDAKIATKNNVICVNSKNELIEFTEAILKDELKLKELAQRGFDFVKNNGTYFHRAQKFIKLKEDL